MRSCGSQACQRPRRPAALRRGAGGPGAGPEGVPHRPGQGGPQRLPALLRRVRPDRLRAGGAAAPGGGQPGQPRQRGLAVPQGRGHHAVRLRRRGPAQPAPAAHRQDPPAPAPTAGRRSASRRRSTASPAASRRPATRASWSGTPTALVVNRTESIAHIGSACYRQRGELRHHQADAGPGRGVPRTSRPYMTLAPRWPVWAPTFGRGAMTTALWDDRQNADVVHVHGHQPGGEPPHLHAWI